MDGKGERQVVQCARRLLFDPEHAFRDAARRLRARSREIRDSKNQQNCARGTLVEIWDGAVFILFLATHTFWLPLAAEDPQQRDAALVVGCKNMTILALHHQIALLLRCDCGHTPRLILVSIRELCGVTPLPSGLHRTGGGAPRPRRGRAPQLARERWAPSSRARPTPTPLPP